MSGGATVTGAATDPAPGNNSATDTDTLTAQADRFVVPEGVREVVGRRVIVSNSREGLKRVRESIAGKRR